MVTYSALPIIGFWYVIFLFLRRDKYMFLVLRVLSCEMLICETLFNKSVKEYTFLGVS